MGWLHIAIPVALLVVLSGQFGGWSTRAVAVGVGLAWLYLGGMLHGGYCSDKEWRLRR